MKELIRSAIRSLPDGIAVHGTTQSRSESILKEGLTQSINYFNIIRISPDNDPKQELYSVLQELTYPISQALKATRNESAFDSSFSNDFDDTTPGLIIFFTPQEFDANEVGFYTDKPVPAENMIGSVTLDSYPSNASFSIILANDLNTVFRSTVKVYELLKEKGLTSP